MQECNGLAIAGHNRRPLDALSARQGRGTGMIHRNFPQMPVVGVALVRRIDKVAAVRAPGDMLNFELAGCQLHRAAALRRNGIQMYPAGPLPGKDDAPVRQ